MTFLRLLRLSITRRPGKSLGVLVGFLLCWAALFGLITLSAGAAKAAYEGAQGRGFLLLLTPPAKKTSFSYGGVAIASDVTVDEGELQEELLAPLESLGKVLPKIVATGTVGDRQVLVAGVYLQEEIEAKAHWQLGGASPREGFLVGAVAAEVLGVKAGEDLRIGLSRGGGLEGGGLEGPVEALLEPTGGPEDRLVFTSLEKVEKALDKKGALTFAEVLVQGPADQALRDVVAIVGEGAKVTLVQDGKGGRMELAASLSSFTLLVGTVILVLASCLLFVTLWGSVQERQKEWGIFLALGFGPGRIKSLILWEGISLALLGALAGSLLGYALAFVLAPWVSDEPFPLAMPYSYLAGGLLLSALLALAAAYYPAAKGASTDPVDSFRQV